jgi:hypothetical protein
MLQTLGWNVSGVSDPYDKYAEHLRFRSLNERLLRGEKLIESDAVTLHDTSKPWVLKDPRFVWTWQHWKPYLDTGTCLLWLTRDLEAVAKSIRKQQWGKESPYGLLLRGRTLPEHEAECQRCFDAWNGPKVKIAYEDIHKAVALFDLKRG